MSTRKIIDTWYKKVLMHLLAIAELAVLPITLPITIGFVIWWYFKGEREYACAIWAYSCASIRFIFTHNLNRFCDDYDVCSEKMDRALNL